MTGVVAPLSDIDLPDWQCEISLVYVRLGTPVCRRNLYSIRARQLIPGFFSEYTHLAAVFDGIWC